MKSVLVLALFLATEPAQQFDLICAGKVRYDLLAEPKPKTLRLRVDIQKKQYCDEPPPEMAAQIPTCAVLHPIAEVQPGVIFFEKESPEDLAAGVTRSRIVNRTTGQYLHYEREPGRASVIAVEATCEPAPFSGFPRPKAKF